MLLGRTISLNEATATASPVRAGGQRITSSEVYAWTLSAKGEILWADFVEDAEDPGHRTAESEPWSVVC